MDWITTKEYIIGFNNQTFNSLKDNNVKQVAMFDLDNTLIRTKSRKTFPINKDDWEFLPNVKKTIRKYNKKNIPVIIITNQKGLKNCDMINDFKTKISIIANYFDFIICISLLDGIYRKPCIGFYQFFNFIEKSKLFYCGDACGRETDHADTDLKFSLNLGIEFYTPEHIFNKVENLIGQITYPDLKNYKKLDSNFDFSNDKYFIILVGLPGSGKSTFVAKYLKNFHKINQDTLKTNTKCQKEIIKNKNKNIVIDNTNPSREIRKKFIDLIKDTDYQIVCIYFDVNYDVAKHNNYYRHIVSGTKLVPEIAYRVYNKNFTMPTKEEGFHQLIHISFQVDNSDSNYFMYYY